MGVSPSGTSFFGTRLMVGLGGLNIEPPLLLLMLRGFEPMDCHFYLSVADLCQGYTHLEH